MAGPGVFSGFEITDCVDFRNRLPRAFVQMDIIDQENFTRPEMQCRDCRIVLLLTAEKGEFRQR